MTNRLRSKEGGRGDRIYTPSHLLYLIELLIGALYPAFGDENGWMDICIVSRT